MLWLSIYLPNLAMDVFSRGGRVSQPLVVIDHEGTRQRVHICNSSAEDCGISSGMAFNSALSLLRPDSIVRSRKPALEEMALERLAGWAGQFTSVLSIVPAQGLLLEIGRSLKLFGGLNSITEMVDTGIRQLGYDSSIAVAPTPIGAWLLSRVHDHRPVTSRSDLKQRLTALPLGVLELESSTLSALRGMGLRTFGDCLHLPKAGFARRLGPEVVSYLQKALGERPDSRKPYVPPPRFISRLLLPAEVEHTEGLLFSLRRQLVELEGALRGHGSGIQKITLKFFHRDSPNSQLTVGLLAPSRESAHMLELVKTRLERFDLPAPVEEILMEAEQFIPLTDAPGDLFGNDKPREENSLQLVEKLQARLGPEVVHGCRIVADHRPEYATQQCPPGEKSHHVQSSPEINPFWLLDTPVLLKEQAGMPWHHGTLYILRGPMRIESGWWDEHPVRRDYFIAESQDHRRFWIFRTLTHPCQWFLHGVFS